MKKRILSLALAILMIFSCISLASCTKTNTSGAPEKGALTTKSLQNVFRAENLPLSGTVLENFAIQRMSKLSDGKILIQGYDVDNYEETNYITDYAFSSFTEVPFAKEEGENVSSSFQCVTSGPDGSVWYIKSVYHYSYMEENSTYEIAVDDVAGYGETENNAYLVKVDGTGNIVLEQDITETIMVSDSENGYEYLPYVNTMLFTDNAITLFVDGTKAINLDINTLEKVSQFDFENYVESVFQSQDGRIFFLSWGSSSYQVSEFDPVSGKTSEVKIGMNTERLYSYYFHPGCAGYDFILTDVDAVYGYNFADAEPVEICNFTNSDVNVGYGIEPIFISPEEFLIGYYDYDQSENVALRMTKIPADQITEKYIITVAGSFIDTEFKAALMKFNRTNDRYKVIFRNYSQYNNQSNNWNGAVEQLDRDILSVTNAPDIILIDSYSMDLSKYTSKNVFLDLYTLLEGTSFNKADYLENVLGAFETNGKLYAVSPVVSFTTLIGKASRFGDKTGWTLTEFLEMHKSLPEGASMYQEQNRQGFGATILSLAAKQFVGENGRCSFDSDEFKSLLSYLKDIPATYDAYESLRESDPRYWDNYELAAMQDKAILRNAYISSFNQIPEFEVQFGEPVSFIGYPMATEGISGTLISPQIQLAVTNTSKVKEGCAQVLMYLLSDEFQDRYAGGNNRYGSYTFPIRKSSIEKKKENDLKPRYYTYYEDGVEKQEEYENTYWIGGEQVELRKSTEEDTQRIYDLISSATVVSSSSTQVTDIINEEAQPYFDGQKSVDDVANIINSRVQIKINE